MLIALLAVLLFPVNSLAAEISDTISVWRWIEPDVYKVSITVSAEGNSEREVLRKLALVDEEIRKASLNYKGGNFSVSPVREWDSSRKRYITRGFSASASYTFLFKKAEEQEELFKVLNRAVKRARAKYRVNFTRWEASEGAREELLNQLKRELLLKALSEGEMFSRVLGGECSLKSLHFSHTFRSPPVIALKAEALSREAPKPKEEPSKVEVRASVKFECSGGKER